jgi:hypothetical protein
MSRGFGSLQPMRTPRTKPVPKTVNAIEQCIGRTQAGGDFVIRALDPCAEVKTGGTCIPDLTANSTVAMNFNSDFTMVAPANLGDEDWDAYIMLTNLPEAPVLYWTKKSSQADFDFNDDPTIITAPSIVYASTESPLPLATSNKHPWELKTDGPTLGQYSSAFRTTFKGLSCIVDMPTLNNEGRVHAGQLRIPPTEITQLCGQVDATGNIIKETGVSVNAYVIGKLPTNVAALKAACPNFLRSHARNGFYIPGFFNQSTHTYTPCPWDPMATTSRLEESRVIKGVHLEFIDETGKKAFDRVLTQRIGGSGDKYQVAVSGADNTQVGIAIISGVTKSAIFDLRLELGVEAVASANSPWYPFQRNAPLPDLAALQEHFIIQNQMAPAYVEKFNSAALLVPVIGAIVSTLVPMGIEYVTKWLKKRSDRPTQPVDIPVD